MKYRIVRRWTTKNDKVTGEIVEKSEYQFYIQCKSISSIIFYGGWKDLHLIGFNTLKEAQDDLDRRLKKRMTKEVEHQVVEVKI